MNSMLFVVATFSLAMIALLWRGDPKRRRVAGQPDKAYGAGLRRFVLAAAVLPGTLLAAMGDAAAFLVWLGGCVIGGWLIAQIQPPRPSAGRRRRD
jgi:hypothetical protein